MHVQAKVVAEQAEAAVPAEVSRRVGAAVSDRDVVAVLVTPLSFSISPNQHQHLDAGDVIAGCSWEDGLVVWVASVVMVGTCHVQVHEYNCTGGITGEVVTYSPCEAATEKALMQLKVAELKTECSMRNFQLVARSRC
jgi:hypothetical protein